MRPFKAFLICVALLAVALAGLGAYAPLRVLNTLAAAGGGVSRQEGVAYGPLERQRLDVYTPTTAAPPRGWPVVVFFYGGSWNTGERAEYRFVGSALAARGVLTLVADYRLYPAVRYPEFLRDSALALAWGLTQAPRLGGDPARVFVMGHSAGGYNAAMLALDPRWLAGTGHAPAELAGWIGLAGPYDFFPTDNREAQPVFFHPDYPANAQPIDFAAAKGRPVFLGAPLDDAVVNPNRSTRALAARQLASGSAVTSRLYPRASHATLIGAFAAPLRWIAPVLDDVLAFIAATPAVQHGTAFASTIDTVGG
ncbi:MAG TPA: alpha/beta hydrolase [Burkholderiaceae bacterium]|nr:alpha/beta hydrolase [Burkholderiaceae bacterium]